MRLGSTPGHPGPRRRKPDPAKTEEFTNLAAVRWVPNSAAGTACMRDLRCVLAAARHGTDASVAEIAM